MHARPTKRATRSRPHSIYALIHATKHEQQQKLLIAITLPSVVVENDAMIKSAMICECKLARSLRAQKQNESCSDATRQVFFYSSNFKLQITILHWFHQRDYQLHVYTGVVRMETTNAQQTMQLYKKQGHSLRK